LILGVEPVPVVTAIEVQKRNKERVNVYLDGDYAFSINILDGAKLRKGQTLSDADIAGMQGEDLVVRAVDSAARFLGHRPRSIAEVRKNLKEKDFDEGVIDVALERLTALGYLDDRAFARYWVESRTHFKPLGTTALRYELRQKGVSEAVLLEVLETVDDESGAYAAAVPLLKRIRGVDRRTARQKLSTTLARRGFAFDVVRTALERLFDEVEEEDANYFTGEDSDTDDT
jgi:regulatory protein